MGDRESGEKLRRSKGWTFVRIAGLVALGISVSLLVAYASRQPDPAGATRPEVMPPPTQSLPSPTAVLYIPGMPVFCTATPDLAAPTPSPQPTGPAFGLAWFHKPPGDDTSAKAIAEANRYIHLTGPSDIEFRDELRAAGYKGPIFTYVTAYAVEGPGPYRDASADCDQSYTPYDNNIAWERGDFCRYIHPNESWFLHNGAGERLVDDYFGTGRYTYVMNPADAGWRAFAQERLLYIKEHWGYDGLWLDNVDLDLGRATRESKNSDGRVREYSSDADWRSAMAGWLQGVRGKLGDWPVWANIVGGTIEASAWDAYAPYLDGAMDESFAVRWVDDRRTDEEWEAQLQRAERWLDTGKGLVMVGQGPRDDTGRMLFTLASYMLVANERASYRYTRFDQYYDSLWLYPQFETAKALGGALGPRYEVEKGVWRREFAGGYVEVNVRAHTGSLVSR